MNSIRLTCLMAAALAWATWCPVGLGETGRVFDRATGVPIVNARVVAYWTGVIKMPVQSTSKCYRAEAAITDEKGEFSISRFSGNWHPLLMDRERNVSVRVPDYKISPAYDGSGLQIPMEPRTGTSAEQFKELDRFLPTECTDDPKILLPYLKTHHAELVKLAATNEEKLAASGVLFTIEEIELGEHEASRRLGERKTKLLQERAAK